MSVSETISKTVDEIREMERTITTLQTTVKALETELQDAKQNVDVWKRKAEAVRLDPIEKENDRLRLRVSHLEGKITDMENQQGQTDTLLEELRKKIRTKDTEIIRLTDLLRELPVDVLNKLVNDMYQISFEHGWHDGDEKFVTKDELVRAKASEWVANFHGEATEFWDAYREGKWSALCGKKFPDGSPVGLSCFEEELADLVIRPMVVAASLGVNLGKAILIKSAYNRTRPWRHGNKLA